MDRSELLSHVDHTLLRPDATWGEIQQLCDEALKYHTASVCVPPSYVTRCANYLRSRIPVCTVVGFPNGYNTTKIKAFEAAEAVQNGADEIDMVINLGWVKDEQWGLVMNEIQTVKRAAALTADNGGMGCAKLDLLQRRGGQPLYGRCVPRRGRAGNRHQRGRIRPRRGLPRPPGLQGAALGRGGGNHQKDRLPHHPHGPAGGP